MRGTWLLVACLAAPATALANSDDQGAAPPLENVLSRARVEKKPVLLDFGAVWCTPCKFLDRELEKPDNAKLLEAYVVQRYDAERGAGAAAAERYEVVGFPTLVVVDQQGALMARRSGGDGATLGAWLKAQAAAARTDAELEAAVKANPSDVDALEHLARRAEARGDRTAMRAWQLRIEAADASKDRAAAASVGWQRLTAEVDEKLRADVRAATLAYIEKYPAQGADAVKALASAGADDKTLDAELQRVVAATSDMMGLSKLALLALSLGAIDAAQQAAEKLVELRPELPHPFMLLAKVHYYRGDRARAVEMARKALELKDVPPSVQVSLRAQLKGFETGERDTELPPRPALLTALTAPKKPPVTPDSAAKRLYSESMAVIAGGCEKVKHAGMGDVYVRVRVGPGRVEQVEILEPSAPKPLKVCLEKGIRSIAVPAEQKPAGVVVPISL